MTVPAWRACLANQQGWEEDRTLTISILAPGVWRRRNRLRELLGPDVQLVFGRKSNIDAIAGWGRKGTGQATAEERGLPYIAIEDAFLSRLGTDEKRFGLLGIVIDPVGIYYDAHHPSLVEDLVAKSALCPPDDQTDALLAEMRDHGLGKFNTLDHERLTAQLHDSPSADVIVVDQIAGDLSIPGGMVSPETFEDMIQAAHDENPGQRIGVKLHPYDGIGGRTGHLRELAERYDCAVIPNTVSWMACAEKAQRVYVASSNAGLEALIAGSSVTCFGVAFFGGWGLTDDRQSVERRSEKPTLSQLCSAVYGQYGHYWLPSLQRSASPLSLARFISVQQKHVQKLGTGLTLHGVPKLKRSHIRPFVPANAPLSIRPALHPKRQSDTPTAVWASRYLKNSLDADQAQSTYSLYAEDGFIRSSGLGADLVKPSSLVFDERGIYFDPRRPSDLEYLLENRDLTVNQRERGAALIAALQESRVSKYNVGSSSTTFDNVSKPIILVPGQVTNDASVLVGGAEVKSNRDLLLAVRQARPDAHIAYKPHPDVEVAGRPGHVPDADDIADSVLSYVSADAAITIADEVHTITSLMGFEALLRRKRVTTYGRPFYAGWGLTSDKFETPRRTRTRSVEELVYLALVEYPLYASPLNGWACAPEDVIEYLSTRPKSKSSIPGGRSAMRLWRKLKTWPDYLR
ncbi:MAG: capsular polysaccharide biosynthesis protein [Pseudomonadota bacterium]